MKLGRKNSGIHTKTSKLKSAKTGSATEKIRIVVQKDIMKRIAPSKYILFVKNHIKPKNKALQKLFSDFIPMDPPLAEQTQTVATSHK